jgi:hypothetical protein
MATDTSAAAARTQLEALRRMGPEARAAMALRMSHDARVIAIEGVMRRRPGTSRAAAEREVFARVWGPELAAKVEAFLAARR